MKLNEALTNLATTEEEANLSLEDFEPKYRPGHEMRKRQAKGRLPAVRLEVKKAMMENSFPVFLFGKNSEKFIELSKAQVDSVTVDFGATVKEMTDSVRQSVGPHKEFGPSQFATMMRAIRVTGQKIGFESFPANFNWTGTQVVNTNEDVDAVLFTYITKYLGGTFLAALIEEASVDKVKSTPVTTPTVLTFITNFPEQFVDDVGTKYMKGVFVSVNTDEDVNEDFVLNTFKEIKKKMKTLKTKEQ